MEWISNLLWGESVAHIVLIYSFVIAVGVALGKIKVFNISLGITFVLFAGIAVGHFGFRIEEGVLDFVREFGLILFVFSIGLQVGPGFFASFKKGGISLNLLAVAVVLLGAGITLLIHFISGIPVSVMAGVMSGAVTNTPGLGAAQQALKQVAAANPEMQVPNIGLGYAVAYPFGVLGIILTLLLIKKLTHVKLETEIGNSEKNLRGPAFSPEKMSIKITNPQTEGKSIQEIKKILKEDVVISRLLHHNEIIVPKFNTILHLNDIILVVSAKESRTEVIKLFGEPSETDLSLLPNNLVSRQLVVSNRNVVGKKLSSLQLRARFGINITRVFRAGVEFVATPGLELQMGDKLTIVGEESAVENAVAVVGNSLKRLKEPNLIPIFIGIFLGIVLGSIPFVVPGIPTPIKLGMAGGPLIAAILISKFGYKFSIVSYTTHSANLMLREIGIVLFLASVGLKAGKEFIPILASGDGLIWMAYGAIITMFPILMVGLFARLIMKKNYFETCGLLSGSMTDPPALAFSNSLAQSEAPAMAYSTVYPLVMFLRIIIAQLLVLLFSF